MDLTDEAHSIYNQIKRGDIAVSYTHLDVYKRQEYHLIDNEIKEVYRVINKDNVMMHFSIGGHPAFVTPENRCV